MTNRRCRSFDGLGGPAGRRARARSRAAAQQPVEAPLAATRHEQVEEDETKKYRQSTTVEEREGTFWRMRHEVRNGHLARQDEGDRASEQAKHYQNAAHCLERSDDARHQTLPVVGRVVWCRR